MSFVGCLSGLADTTFAKRPNHLLRYSPKGNKYKIVTNGYEKPSDFTLKVPSLLIFAAKLGVAVW